MDIVGLRVATRNLRDLLIRPTKIVPPAVVPLQQIQLVINWMSSEGKLSHLVRCDIIVLHYYRVFLLIV
jgi:hypothetical protein